MSMDKPAGDYITTYSGRHFYPLSPDPDDILIEDIAHALSLICRGNGQVRIFHSVGEHCLGCALEARARGYSERVILGCLLHDASVCYMSDVPRPFKKELKDYQEIEDKLLSCIYKKFLGSDIAEEEYMKIKEIDDDLLAHDLYFLLNEGNGENLPRLLHPYGYGNRKMQETEAEYLELYRSLSSLSSRTF